MNPNDGTVNEWITSFDVVTNWVLILYGAINRLSTSNNRNSLFLISLVLIIYESKGIFKNWGYSYDQYHWFPILLIVKNGIFVSSVIYKILIDGITNINKIIKGKTVQINSIVWWLIM